MDFFKKAKHILFLDIETVTCVPAYKELDERMKPFWNKKASYISKESDPENLFFERGGIYAEFGKVISIAVGFFFMQKTGGLSLKVRSFTGEDEAKILQEFKDLIVSKYNPRKLILCAHNGKEFDYPYLCRRMLVNGIELPEALNLAGRKPWEVNHLDTLEMWRFGDKKNYTSLDLLAALFDIPSSKDGMDGSKVNDTWYNCKDLEKISEYCRKDVIVTAQLFLKYNCRPLISQENIIISELENSV